MTMLKPFLMAKRLMVLQGGHAALDLAFHKGVNVIRGRNSSGKTTAMDLLAFALGAENIRWKPEALRCSETIIEVQLNEATACLRREIGEGSQHPMSIYWGTLADAISAPQQLWERYPFKRSPLKSSFSQVLLTALDMPQAQGDGASNLTLHQILRVLYADQPSVHSPIFRLDRWDSTLTREMMGGYLAGVYDDQLYSAQLRARDVDTELSGKISELKGIFNILGHAGQTPDLTLTNYRVEDLEKKREALTSQLIALKSGFTMISGASADEEITKLRANLNSARALEAEVVDRIASLRLEISDSELFVSEVSARLESLDESGTARRELGGISFSFCPCCLMELADSADNTRACHLCKSPEMDSSNETQIVRMRNELALQASESAALLKKRRHRLEEAEKELPLLRESVHRLALEYSAASQTSPSAAELEIERAARALGGIDEEIRQAHRVKALADALSVLQSDRDRLSAELASLRDTIGTLEGLQESRKAQVARVVETAMIRLLRLDLPLQPEFVNAETADFNFVENIVHVNGTKNFSESSAVVLRHVFHLALLTASTQLEYMRIPRFMMLDGIDDGGMEKDRSHRLQKIIVEECSNYEVDYQVIFATSEIDPSIEGTEFVVGRYFSPESRSLSLR
ncbi:AAA family ATPase [Xanthomonas campestris pv. raphani]|uniref:AAA family ATPase n=1 Tax=Xanthomonas campestris TaxID=339 RepID=UPI002B22A818|nr:AAA family ATPase [Xanthomonas campestris]MEA9859579.1 AAA family ATPase [Xanthomonas campestris pv. raphani]MEA9940965.1 AAA family ATPase [Xanthomonas campestris pv. raphani]